MFAWINAALSLNSDFPGLFRKFWDRLVQLCCQACGYTKDAEFSWILVPLLSYLLECDFRVLFFLLFFAW